MSPDSLTLTSIINTATHVVSTYTLGLAFIFVLFFWGVANIIWTSSNPEKRKDANQRLVWGVIAVFIFVSIGSIVLVLANTFFGPNALNQGASPGGSSGSTFTSPSQNNPFPQSSPSPTPNSSSPAPTQTSPKDNFKDDNPVIKA